MKVWKNIAILTLASFAAACAAEAPVENADEVYSAPHTAEAGAPLTFDATSVNVSKAPGFTRLSLGGTINGSPAALHVDVDAGALIGGTTLTVDGETWFSSASDANFEARPPQAASVQRAWVYGGCTGCPMSETWQMLHGSVTIDHAQGEDVSGRFDLVLEGRVPSFAGPAGDMKVVIAGPFATGTTPSTPVAPTPSEQTTQPSETSTAPAQGGATAEEPGPVAAAVSPVFEVTLTRDQGVNLATGERVTKANWSNSDLFATAGHAFMKLSAGGSNPTQSQPLRWFANSGGFVRTFDTLADVPLELPTDAHASQSIVNAKRYVGFVVQSNLSDTWARVWIAEGTKDQVTLEWQLIAPAQ